MRDCFSSGDCLELLSPVNFVGDCWYWSLTIGCSNSDSNALFDARARGEEDDRALNLLPPVLNEDGVV